ncbi:hypothetical protein [Spirochaeta dissipatitropha]
MNPISNGRLGIFVAGFRWSGSGALSDWLTGFSALVKPSGTSLAYDEIRALNYGVGNSLQSRIHGGLFGERLGRFALCPDTRLWKEVLGPPLYAGNTLRAIDYLYTILIRPFTDPHIKEYGPMLSAVLGRDFRNDTEYLQLVKSYMQALRDAGQQETESAFSQISDSVSSIFALLYDRISEREGSIPIFDNAVSGLRADFFRYIGTGQFPVQHIYMLRRDPRDQFTELVKFSPKNHSFLVNSFIRQYRNGVERAEQAVQDLQASGRSAFLLSFEEFVYNRNGIREQLRESIQADLAAASIDTTFDSSAYDAERSKQNIGIWKESGMPKAMQKISQELPSYLAD